MPINHLDVPGAMSWCISHKVLLATAYRSRDGCSSQRGMDSESTFELGDSADRSSPRCDVVVRLLFVNCHMSTL